MSGTSGFTVRLTALTRKETRQMLRDRSNLIVGLVLPVVLLPFVFVLYVIHTPIEWAWDGTVWSFHHLALIVTIAGIAVGVGWAWVTWRDRLR